MNSEASKGTALLKFLAANAALRRGRVVSYGASDQVMWFGELPRERPECRSPFLSDNPDVTGDFWLQVDKKREPMRPPVPDSVADWVSTDDLDQVDAEPELRAEITVPDAQHALDLGDGPAPARLLRLVDHSDVQDAWLSYLLDEWQPWAERMRRWREVQEVYGRLDYMRRRIEESEERYEFLLAVGLLQWRAPTGEGVKRHLLTAPAEIDLDAARGVLTVVPAADFDRFRVELDMLEPQTRPRLDDDWMTTRSASSLKRSTCRRGTRVR